MKISLGKSKKKIIMIAVLVLVIAALMAGLIVFFRYRQAKNTVNVVPVANINMYMGESSNQEISGTVTATKSQEVVLSSNQIVREVLVKKGQKVEAGTDLLRLDTEEEQIDLELKSLGLQEIQQKITKLNREIAEIQAAPLKASSTKNNSGVNTTDYSIRPQGSSVPSSFGTGQTSSLSKLSLGIDYVFDYASSVTVNTADASTKAKSVKKYTAQQKQKLIAERQSELNSLQLDLKEENLEYAKLQKKIQNATIKSTIKGTVKSIQDPSTYVSGKGKTFLKIVSSEGLYLQGSVSELKLGSIQVGDEVTAKSWDTGEEFTAKVTEISPYPVQGNDMSGGLENPNASYYPFKAYIKDTESVSNGEFVTITLGESSVAAEDGVYLPPAYIRKDGNRNYVYLKGEKDLLEKKYIKTGKSSYGVSIEVLEGVTLEDYIAFPYGKNVKEGARTKVSDGGMDYGGEY